jgi:osmotically-inducible protein OsmY
MSSRVDRLGVFGLLGTALLLATPALAATDTEVLGKIEGRLAKAHLGPSAEVRVTVEKGVAHLSGTTTSLVDARAAEKAARKVTKHVVNQVHVLPEPRGDNAIRKDAESAVLSYPYYGVFDAVGVDVADGVVTLRGWVLQPWQSSAMEERVAHVAGVRELHDQIQVESASPMDVALRRDLDVLIYGNQMFEPYANLWDKPVRIIVDRGKVTLAGVVNSAVEKAVAGNIARGTLAFSVDNHLKVTPPPLEPSRTKPSGIPA